MPPPKLMKKHRTFDCDLIDMERQQQQQQRIASQSNNNKTEQPSSSSTFSPSSTTTTTTTTTHTNKIENIASSASNKLQNPTECQTNNDTNYYNNNDDDDDDQFDANMPNSYQQNTSANLKTNAQFEIETDAQQQQQQQQQCLSKLVLSSSLHQLADSKYHTNYNQNQNQNCQTTTNAKNQSQLINNMDKKNVSTANAGAASAAANATMPPSPSPPPLQQRANNGDEFETFAASSTTLATVSKNDPQYNNHQNNNNNNNSLKHDQIAKCYNNNQNQQYEIENNNFEQQNVNGKKINNTQQHNKTPTSSTIKREANLDTVHVVVGNESCDLDSAVSCLLMFHIISKMSDEINGRDKTRTLYIPLLNTTRDMLDSKCEVLWFLQKTLNIDKSFLTCKDDIDWNEIKKNNVEVLVTLVDHNYNEEFKDIGKIVEIIDHHQVQNSKWLMENHDQIRLTLDTQVGSCTTLVAERLFYIYAEHHVSDEILLLIYGTVLLDTICLSEKAKRFTRRDVYLLKKLDNLLGSKRPLRDSLYKQLVEIKNSTREMNFEQLMKRDLKIYKDKHGMRVGIASLFGMAAREALGLAANIDLDLFFRLNHYEAFIIMGLIADLEHSDSISRDLVLISANKSLFKQLCQAFEMDTSKLDLQPIGSDSSPDPEDNIINNKRIVDSSSDLSKATISDVGERGRDETGNSGASQPFYKARIWLQRNVTSSRKVVAPLVLKVLHDGAQ